MLLRMPAEELVEMVAISGFDFVLIDCEHGPADLIPLRQHIALAAPRCRVSSGSARTSRPWRSGPSIRGPPGSSPRTSTTPAPRRAGRPVHYPPLGHRGFATYSRAGRFGLVDPADPPRAAERDAGLRHDRVPGRCPAAADVLGRRASTGS